MSDPYLKPCPFCGSTHIKCMAIAHSYDAWCEACGCTGGGLNGKSDHATKESATAAWNLRPAENALEAALEAARYGMAQDASDEPVASIQALGNKASGENTPLQNAIITRGQYPT